MTDVTTLLCVTLWVGVVTWIIVEVVKDARSRHITAATLFIAISLVFINVGMFFRWLQTPPVERLGWPTDAFLVSTLGLFFFLLGKAVGSIRPSKPKFAIAASPRVGLSNFTLAGARGLPFACIVVLAASSLYFLARGSLPLLQGLSDLAASGQISNGLVSSHRNARDSYSGTAVYLPGQGLLEAARYWGLPLVLLWSWIMIAKKRWRAMGRIFTAASIVLSVASGQRWPLMYLLVAVLLVGMYVFTWRGKSILRWAGLTLLSGVVLSALLGRGAQGISSVGAALQFGAEQLASRLFLEQSLVPFISFQFSRESLLPDYATTFTQNLMAYLPGEGASYPVTFSRVITGSTGFTAPPDFFTEAWINGGWAMVAVLPFVWGLLLSRATIGRSESVAAVGYRTVWITVLGFSGIAGVSQSFSVLIVYVAIYVAQFAGQTLASIAAPDAPRRNRVTKSLRDPEPIASRAGLSA